VKIYTSRFGEIDVDKNKVINFARGILGFPEAKRYVVLDHMNNPEIPFKWLQAIDKSDLAFVITDPLLFYPDYNPGIEEKDLKELKISDSSDYGTIVLVTIPHGEPEKMTANLQGPIVLNLKTRDARQIVLLDDEYSTRYPLLTSHIQLQSPTVK